MQRNETMYIKSGNRFTPVIVRQEYKELPAVKVEKGGENWILKTEDLLSQQEVEEIQNNERIEKLKERFSDILSVFSPEDTHITLAKKLGIIPLAAFNKLAAIRKHGLI